MSRKARSPSPPTSSRKASSKTGETTMERLMKRTNVFVMSIETCHKVSKALNEAIHKGLSKATHAASVVKCFPTYVQCLPNEKSLDGFCLSLDLGGTNSRILEVSLHGSDQPSISQKSFKVPQYIQTGRGADLFNFLADCFNSVIEEHHLQAGPDGFPLAFTFSYPVVQHGLKRATLVTWTKGFACSGVVGKDVVELLEIALKSRCKQKINVLAIVNDTTAVLMSCAQQYPECRIGVINGTGCNACYLEQLDKVEMFVHDSSTRNQPPQCIINCELGAFGNFESCEELSACLTKYDRMVDMRSINPGKQIFEKMCSGMYLGEYVREVLLEAADKKYLFKGKTTQKLETANIIDSSFLSKCEEDIDSQTANTSSALQKMLEISDASAEDCHAVRAVCERVSTRSAHLVALATATLVRRVAPMKMIVIGVEGSVFELHPHFKARYKERLAALLGPKYPFAVETTKESAGVGAAVVVIAGMKAAKKSADSSSSQVLKSKTAPREGK